VRGRLIYSFFALFFCCSVGGVAQGVPNSSTTLQLGASDARGAMAPAGSISTLLSFTVEADTAGNDFFDVVTSDPAVVISLILPSGVEVTSANATAMGFTLTIIPAGTNDTVEIPSALSLPGTHTTIQIPGGQTSGTYMVKANASAATAGAAVLATYFSSSTAKAAVTTDAANYKVGDTVVLSGLVFDGATPVTGATVVAAVSSPVSLAAQTSIGNYQLVSQIAVNSNLTDYSYSVTLTNTGPAEVGVLAQQFGSLPAGVTILNDTLAFGNIAANSSTTGLNTVTVERSPNQSFDPSTLQWNVMVPGLEVNTPLVDSGQFDAASGDGIYTGTFTPAVPGQYVAVVSITGTSLAGKNFSRTASVAFQVTQQQLASFASFADEQVDTGVAVSASVNVQTPGTYSFDVQLQSSNHNVIQGGATANLSAGIQSVTVAFPNSSLFGLGVDGPYERMNATLVQTDSFGNTLLADAKADAGPAAPYTLVSVAPPLYFTGQISATGVITGSGPSFDLLRVQAGVNSANADTCSWGGRLTDSAGNRVDNATGSGSIAAGANSITLDFNGLKIAQSAGGPYTVSQLSILCSSSRATSPSFIIQGFPASQFTSITPDFTTSLSGSAPSGPAGSSTSALLQVTSAGGFGGTVTFSISGLPTGVTGAFTLPEIIGSGFTKLTLTVPGGFPPGIYSFTVGSTSGTSSKTLPLTLTVTGTVALPTFSPAAGNYSSAELVTISTATPGASIRYTTDGSIPTSGTGTLYGGAITVGATMTIKAIAYASGLTDSAVVSATYTITLEPSISGRIGSITGTSPQLTLNVVLTNSGSATAAPVNVNTITFRVLTGTGSVAFTSPALTLPVVIPTLAAGASQTIPVNVTLTGTVQRFSITESGTLTDPSNNAFSFSIGQSVIPPN
jgi:hypothetical protein